MTEATQRRPLVAGNWKMNGSRSLAKSLAGAIAAAAKSSPAACDLVLCPPTPYLMMVAGVLDGSAVALGAQNCHAKPSGAHTGEISAAMLADTGCRYVILGHSERRADQGESDADVRAKAEAAIKAGLSVILCVGETEAQRDSGAALAVVGRQLAASLPEGAQAAHLAVAYEPVWAIGTGRTPTEADIAAMHQELRGVLGAKLGVDQASRTRILYGGSVKPSNAVQIMALADVDGALVGGASLVAADFLAIAAACR